MPRVLQCVGPSYPLEDRKSSVQRSVNLRLREIEGQGEDKQLILDSVDGLTAFKTFGAAVRGQYATESRWFCVAGATLYEVSADASVTVRGTLASLAGWVDMIHGENQLVVVDGDHGYALNLATNAFGQIVSPAWRGSNAVETNDGYFIFVAPDTQQFYLSAIDDATKLDALDFSSTDTQPDKIVRAKVCKREVFFFGEISTEVWVDSGDPDFPFVRYGNVPIDVGLVGERAIVSAADTLFFVGRTKGGTGMVYAMSGHQPTRISHRAVEEALQGADLTQCVMWSYQARGGELVAISAPGMSTTWVFDVAVKQWHEMAELVDGDWQPSRIESVVHFGNTHYAQAGTKLLKVDPEASTFDGDVMKRERTWPHLISPSMEMVAFASLELACTTGYGGTVALEISNDGGFIFGPPLARSLGAVGRWMERIRWRFLGAARDRVFRLSCSDAVPFRIHAAVVDA